MPVWRPLYTLEVLLCLILLNTFCDLSLNAIQIPKQTFPCPWTGVTNLCHFPRRSTCIRLLGFWAFAQLSGGSGFFKDTFLGYSCAVSRNKFVTTLSLRTASWYPNSFITWNLECILDLELPNVNYISTGVQPACNFWVQISYIGYKLITT